MKPLINAGFVHFEGRRGARTSSYEILDEEKAKLLAAISADLAVVGVVPDEVFERGFAWVLARLHQDDLSIDEKGRTLEVLAAMICWRLGLRHILVRHRTQFEVDVSAEYVGTNYEAWFAQCKAFKGAEVRSEHILREFGIAILNNYSVLLFVTTSSFSDDAKLTADRIGRESLVQVVRLDKRDLASIAADESALFRLVKVKAEATRRLRTGASPKEVLEFFSTARDWLMGEKPGSEEVWIYLLQRDVLVERHVAATLLAAWLEGQRGEAGFDAAYLDRIRAEG